MYGKIKKIIPVIGILIFIYLLIRIGPSNILASMLNADPFYMAVAFLLVIPHLILQTGKWKYILSSQNIRIGYGPLFKIYLMGVFYSMITPGKIGSLMRIFYLKDETGQSFGKCSSSVIIDRILDLLSMFILAILGTAFLVTYISGTLVFLIISAFISFLAFIVIFMREKSSRKILRLIYKVAVPAKFKDGAKNTSTSFYENIPDIRKLIIPFFMTATSWFLVYSLMYFVAIALGLEIPFFFFVTIAPISTIIGLIPITISGWGTREAALIVLFSPFVNQPAGIIALSFLSFITSSLIPSIFGAVLALGKTVKNGPIVK